MADARIAICDSAFIAYFSSIAGRPTAWKSKCDFGIIFCHTLIFHVLKVFPLVFIHHGDDGDDGDDIDSQALNSFEPVLS